MSSSMVALCCVVLACSPRTDGGPAGNDTASAADGGAQDVARLEREARSLARTDGCSSLEQCRAVPLGAKACGGPRAYLPYCAATTDTAALLRTLRELERVERAYNEREQVVSDCMLVAEPVVALQGGRCQFAAPTP